MNEFELIARLTQSLPSNPSVVHGVGHDCAVLDLGVSDRYVLFKTDAVVEGVHFESEVAPERIGHKALARCLSDVAAMSGEPNSAVVTLGLPERFEIDFVERIYAGLNALAGRHHIAIVGGETVRNPERIFISVAVVGTVEQNRLVTRAGAKARDALFVTGKLGGSISGKHLDFEPRLREARWLTEHFSIHAMMDLSDGLAGDLRHLLAASGVGAHVLATAIPISREAKLMGRLDSAKKTPLLAALTDGEDFELLFAVASRDAVPMVDAWKKKFPDLPLTCIGRVTADLGITIRDKQGAARPMVAHGYTHFA